MGNKLSKYYSDSFENNPPSGLSINEWDAGWILAKAHNDNAVEFKSHWFDGLMMRKRNNGTWSAYEKIPTNADIPYRLSLESDKKYLVIYDNKTNAKLAHINTDAQF